MAFFIPKTFLFVPATRLDRVAKAVERGADCVIIDLEDAVIGADKDTLRGEVARFCQSWDWQTFGDVWLRINAVRHVDFAADVALAKILPICGVVLPKTISADEVNVAYAHAQKPIIAVIECAHGLLGVADIAQAKGVWALSYGCLDLAQSFGMTYGTPSADGVFDRVRMDLLLHSAVNGLHPPIETIYPDFSDDVGLVQRVKAWRDLGFGGQLLIHPKQVATVKQHLFDQKQLDFAKKVIAHHQATGEAVFAIDGQMVDMPVIRWAGEYVAQVKKL